MIDVITTGGPIQGLDHNEKKNNINPWYFYNGRYRKIFRKP